VSFIGGGAPLARWRASLRLYQLVEIGLPGDARPALPLDAGALECLLESDHLLVERLCRLERRDRLLLRAFSSTKI
jgi:hypothetical protein